MHDVLRVIAAASRRLWLMDLLRVLAVVLSVALGLLLLTLIVERALGLALPWRSLTIAITREVQILIPWGAIPLWTLVSAASLTLVIAIVRRRKTLSVARELDERAGLRESLSTAWFLQRADDPWSRAVVEEASQKAQRVKVGLAIPFEAPRLWPVPVGGLLAFVLGWNLIPVFDLLGGHEQRQAEAQRQAQVQQVAAEIRADTQKLEELLARANVRFEEDPLAREGQASPNAQELDPDALRRASVRQLTNVADRLESMQEGEKAQQMEAMREAMRQLRQPGDGPLDNFSRALARGDFNRANAELEQMQQKMGDGSMSPEQQEQMKRQMENLARQLEQLSNQQQQLQKALQEQGLDRQTAQQLAQKAADPEALKQALEQMQNLSEEQVQKLMEMAQSAQKAGEACQNMSEGLSQMAQGLGQEGLTNEGMAGMEELAAELSDMEMLQADMENLDAALQEARAQLARLGECMGGQCEGGNGNVGNAGMWRPGGSQRMGMGSGGPGRGTGPSPEAQEADFQIERTRAPVRTQGGPIIGSRLVFGEQVRGESVADFSAAVEAGSQTASESLETMQVPRELHDAVKTYFGRLQRAARPSGSAPAQPAAPQ